MYFTQEHEDAIINYCNSENRKVKEQLYIQWIQPAFNEMVDKIVFAYKFTSLPNIDDLRMECKVWLTTILDKYDPGKGSKAFSYFSVISKNWFIHKVKKNTKRLQREVPYEEAELELETTFIDPGQTYFVETIKGEFWDNLWLEIDTWDSDFEKDQERKVYEAVKIILESADQIDILNKKAIYLYLRELTGLNTKQVVTQLNKMRSRYVMFKKDWDEGKI
jgi:DNA-directed RNA polymerase specialized sigma subunit